MVNCQYSNTGQCGLADLAESVRKIEQMVASTAAVIVSIQAKVTKTAEIVHEGNGQPPMTVQIARLETRVNQVESDREAEKVRRWQVILAVVVAGLSLLTSGALLFRG